ncbi:MAG: S-layer homology domain-containing protein [Bacillota bacterium]
MKIKRLISLLLIVFIVSSILPLGIVSAEAAPSIELQLDKTAANIGEIIRATIRINNIENFSAYHVNIKYDPTVLQAVNPNTGAAYTDRTMPLDGTLLLNQDYGIVSVATHDITNGILNFAKSYTYLEDYRASGLGEKSGTLAVIGFKVLKVQGTSVRFEDAVTLPNAVSGTLLFDWYGNRPSTDYDIIQPGSINGAVQTTPPSVLPTPTITPTPVLPSPAASIIPSVVPTATPVASSEPQVMPTPVNVDVVPVLDSATGEAKAVIEAKDLNEALASTGNGYGTKVVALNVKEIEGARAYVQELPKESLSIANAAYKIQVVTEMGTIEAPANMLNQQGIQEYIKDKSSIALSIKAANKEELDADLIAEIGDRPLVELNVVVDGQKIAWNNPDAPVKVSIPYTPTAEELLNPEHIVVWYIDNTGKAISVPSGRYESGKVTFTTTHFSKYAVAYVHKTFTDIGSYAWAKKQIEVLASKGVINGTSDTTFNPKADITRADFMVLLVKALGLSASVDSNFDDVASGAYYYEYVGIAKKLGVTTGVGDNKFNPKAKITRQDMMVLTTNALKIAGKISSPGTKTDVDRFSDKAQIASYAVEGVATLVKENIVVGSGNIINPRGNASRAELAAIIYKIYNMY